MIGTQGYPSIKAAVDAAQDGDTVVVTKNHTINDYNNLDEVQTDAAESLINVKDKTITIDLNGKTVIAEKPKANVDYFILITSTGNGHLTLKDSVGGGALKCTKGDSTIYCLMSAFDSESSLTVESGHYELDYADDCLIYASGNETVTINGGTFRLGNVGAKGSPYNYQPWIFNAKGRNERHINVNGGTFNAEVNNQHWIFEAQMPANKALIDNGDGTWTVVDAVAYVNAREWSSAWYTYEVGYTTLEEAVSNVRASRIVGGKDSGTEDVGLVTDCPINKALEVKESFTLILNDKTIIWKGNDTDPMFTVAAGKTLTLPDNFTPKRNGYVFQGLFTDEDRTIPYVPAAAGNATRSTSGISIYAKWSPAPTSSGSGISITYNGGNSFSTSKGDVPTSVEIDGVPVPFTGNGSSFTVGCIDPNAKWVTVRWNSTSVTTNFTPDVNVVCTEIGIPKTGDMPFWAAIAEFLGF